MDFVWVSELLHSVLTKFTVCMEHRVTIATDIYLAISAEEDSLLRFAPLTNNLSVLRFACVTALRRSRVADEVVISPSPSLRYLVQNSSICFHHIGLCVVWVKFSGEVVYFIRTFFYSFFWIDNVYMVISKVLDKCSLTRAQKYFGYKVVYTAVFDHVQNISFF